MVRDASVVLEAVRTLQPDVVVLDISLTSMTGFELAQSLQADGPAVALVFLSAYEEEDLIEAAQDAGAVGYVIKRRLATDLPIAVREAHAGRRFVSPVKL
jgi:DNA-binding NarL/FixJ family response regulator